MANWLMVSLDIILLILVPFLCGYLWSNKETFTTIPDYCNIYILGWIVSFSTFEIIAVPMTFLRASLSITMLIWICSIGGMVILGYGKLKKSSFKQNQIGNSIKLKVSWLSFIVILLIVVQCILQIFFQHIDDDDAWYVGTAVTSYVTDTINVYSPYTGDILEWKKASPYILSPFPVFWAMIARICKIHPTILMHTIAPVILICLAYMIYYILGKQFFKDEEIKAQYFLLFMCVLNLFGYCSTRTVAAMLLLRIWQGKAMMASVLIPVLIYYMNEFKEKKRGYAVYICFTLIAMDLASSMGVFLGILMIGIYICIPLVLHKRLKDAVSILWTIIPSVVLGVMYIFIR